MGDTVFSPAGQGGRALTFAKPHVRRRVIGLGRIVVAIRIFIESLWSLIRHAGQALWVSALPFGAVVVFLLAASILPATQGFFQGDLSGPDVGLLPTILGMILLPICAVVVGWVAVSWHRMVLRSETPGLLPPAQGRPVWPYAGQSLLIWALTLAVVFAGVFVLGLTVALTFDVAATDRLRGILFTLGLVFFTYLWLRWGLALVGTALDKPMTMREAWRATRNSRGTVLGVSVMIVVINRLAEGLITVLGNVPVSVDVLVSAVLIWVTAMLGISSLTTLYGYCVEGRH